MFGVVGVVRRGCIGVLRIEAIRHTDALDWLLRYTSTTVGAGIPVAIQDCRYDIDDVVELVPDAPLVLYHSWPSDRHALAPTKASRSRSDNRKSESPGFIAATAIGCV